LNNDPIPELKANAKLLWRRPLGSHLQFAQREGDAMTGQGLAVREGSRTLSTDGAR